MDMETTKKGTDIDDIIMLDVNDIQKILKIGKEASYALMRNHAFPSVKIGKRYVVEKEAFKRWLKRQEGREFQL